MARERGYKVRKIQDEILTARPEKMKYEEYRRIRKEQEMWIKRRLRGGFMVWKSRSVGTGGERWGTLVGPVPKLVFVK